MRHAESWLWILLVLLPAAAGAADTDVVINEVFYLGDQTGDWVELKNTGSETVDVGSWWFCARRTYSQLSLQPLLTGDDLVLEPGAIVTVAPGFDLSTASDLGLYTSSSFASTAAMVDFVQWGSAQVSPNRSGVAEGKGIWTEVSSNVFDFIETAAAGQSATYCGTDGGGGLLTLSTDLRNTAPTQGLENGDPCNAIFTDGFESGDTSAW